MQVILSKYFEICQEEIKVRIYKILFRSLNTAVIYEPSNSTIAIRRSEIHYFLGWVHGKSALKTFGLELLDEYEFPQPMPEDKFYDYHVDTNQAYLMLATEGTGKLNVL